MLKLFKNFEKKEERLLNYFSGFCIGYFFCFLRFKNP